VVHAAVSDPPHDFAQRYAAALADQLSAAGETGLHHAYELGREALNSGLSIIDIVLSHHQALRPHVLGSAGGHENLRFERAAEFLAECVSPFEMTLLGYREANSRLTALNEKLEEAARTTQLTNERLTTEMTQRQRVEEALWQAQKLQAIGRLAGGVAHHFNNLLTVVLGSLDLSKGFVSGNQIVAERLAAAIRAAERGAAVTRQLLAFSRQQALRLEIFEPSARLNDIALLLGSALGSNIKIEADIPAQLWTIKIDPAELELALLNLGINARDAMPNGGVLRISAENRSVRDERLGLDGEYLTIEVRDEGSGIPPQILPRIFDPFFTTKDIDRGTGLGLSQVHGFAHQSNGAVDVESVVGQGTIFRLYLPALQAPVSELPHQHPPSKTVLIVEDEVDVADVAAAMLQECGFDVHVAYRAQLALELLGRGEHIDLVFSDVLMPGGMNGIDLAQEIERKFPQIKMLLATGYSDALSDAIRKGLQIISKPYRPQELCDRVCALLQ
jgi:signal transduction histidine kinase/CheY-like chemotaxis protein